MNHRIPKYRALAWLGFGGIGDNGRMLARGVYRCVYRFENEGYGVFHGHGDIRIEP